MVEIYSGDLSVSIVLIKRNFLVIADTHYPGGNTYTISVILHNLFLQNWKSFRWSFQSTLIMWRRSQRQTSRKSGIFAAVLKWSALSGLQASFPSFSIFRQLINDGTRTQWDLQHLKIAGEFFSARYVGLSFLLQKKSKYTYLKLSITIVSEANRQSSVPTWKWLSWSIRHLKSSHFKLFEN